MPVWALMLDYALGAVMWTLVARTVMGAILVQDSRWGFMAIIVRLTDPIIGVFRPVTPGFLVPVLVPLFVAWFFFMLRFYILPPLLGFGAMGVLSFPLEGQIAAILSRLFF